MFLDRIHMLQLPLHVIEQRNQKIEPDQYKSVISGMPNSLFRADQQNYYARFLTYYSHFMKHDQKTLPGSENLLSGRIIKFPCS